MASIEEPAVCEWVDRDTKVHLFRLSETNKRSLLQNAAVAAEERLPKSKAFLERLQKLSPEFASQFGLRETAVSVAPLRLLVPSNSKLVEDPFFQVESYIVLSYCWHNESWKPVPRYEKGWWPVSDTMMKVLQNNCKPEEGIWIDQLCIHQDDLDEQRLAVSAMDQIYKSARIMYAVLEDIELSKEDQDATIAFVSEAEMEPATAANLILKIASARWFSRAWCSYEFKTTSFLAGKKPNLLIPLQAPDPGLWQLEVLGFYPNHAVQNYILRSRKNALNDDAALYMQFLGFLDPVGGRGEKKTGDPDLSVQVLNRIERSGCQFITDYIPIILNTSGLDVIFSGTVDTKDQLYYVVSVLALAAGDPAVFSAAGPKLLLPTSSGDEVKSWIHHFGPMEWTIQGRLPEDLSVNYISEEMIDMDLLILEDDPTSPSFPAIDCGTTFVYRCYEEGNPTLVQYYSATQMDIPTTIARLGVNVAAILDLGLPWIRSAWEIFQKDMIAVDARWTTFIQDDPSIWPHIAMHLLPYLLQSSPNLEHNANTDPESYRSLLVPFFSFFLFPNLRGNTLAPQIIRTGPGPTDFALLDPNSNHHTDTPPLVKYAIPAAMASSTFQRSLRVWVLEEMAADGYAPETGRPGMSYLVNQAHRFGGVVTKEPAEPGNRSLIKIDIAPGTITDDTWAHLKQEMTRVNMHEWIQEKLAKVDGQELLTDLNKRSGCWKLVEKAVLWGCPTIVPDGKTVTLLKGQKVYGETKIRDMVRPEGLPEGLEAQAQGALQHEVLRRLGNPDGTATESGDDVEGMGEVPVLNPEEAGIGASDSVDSILARIHLEEARERSGVETGNPYLNLLQPGEYAPEDSSPYSESEGTEEDAEQEEKEDEDEDEEVKESKDVSGEDSEIRVEDGRMLTIFMGMDD